MNQIYVITNTQIITDLYINIYIEHKVILYQLFNEYNYDSTAICC